MILKAIRHILMHDYSVQALQPDVFVGLKPQDHAALSAVLHQISGVRDHHFGGASGWVRGTVQVDAWAPGPKEAHDLADTIRLTLDNRSGNEPGVELAYLELDDQRSLQVTPPKGSATPEMFGVSSDYRYALIETIANP